MAKQPTVLSYAQPGLAPRDLMLGIAEFRAARAFPYEALLQQKLIVDRVGAEPVLLVLAGDGRSVRAFRAPSPGFYRQPEGEALMMDEVTGSRWDFRGCAIEGKAKGTCLQRVEVIQDYWFDWRHYHPETTVYRAHAESAPR
jgi:hypothetical protein